MSASRARRRALGFVAIVTALPISAWAQSGASRVFVRVLHDSTPVADALVRAGMTRATTANDGAASLRLPAGPVFVVASKIGLRPDSVFLAARSGADTAIVIHLEVQPPLIAPVFVTSTRAERRVEDEPLRVEVLGGDDVSEKSEMRPADSRTLLSEMSGVRVQSRSPLGATNVRIQGLPGRYTAILSDGLPLFGGQASSFTLVDVVPLDLRQAEVIKGSSSALYGPQALAGVVNLISRRPSDTNQVLLNQSAPRSTDAMAFLARSLRPSLALTVLGGLHGQNAADEDNDGWEEVPGFRRAEIRPRLFFDDSAGHSFMVTGGGFTENRSAGRPLSTQRGSLSQPSVFYDSLSTRHGDAGIVGQWRARAGISFTIRASATDETHQRRFGDLSENDGRRSGFAELSATDARGSNVSTAGAAFLVDQYASADVAILNPGYSTPGVFIQDTYTPTSWISGTANGRCDRSNIYGTICTPRLSLLARAGPSLSARASAGSGWFSPTPVTDETETFALSRVRIPSPLAAERGRSASFDLTATHGPLQVNGTLFANRVANPVGTRAVPGDSSGLVDLINASGPLETHGGEVFAVFNQEPFIATAYYAATRSRETSTESSRIREAPLTPRQTAGIDFALEDDESGAYGAVEAFYTGRQALEDDPYATVSKPFTTIGILVSDRWKSLTIFLNGENLTNVRLTNYQPLVRVRVGEGGRWTVDPWAPLEGRRINLGVRCQW